MKNRGQTFKISSCSTRRSGVYHDVSLFMVFLFDCLSIRRAVRNCPSKSVWCGHCGRSAWKILPVRGVGTAFSNYSTTTSRSRSFKAADSALDFRSYFWGRLDNPLPHYPQGHSIDTFRERIPISAAIFVSCLLPSHTVGRAA